MTRVMLRCTAVKCPRPSDVTHVVALIYNVPDGVFRRNMYRRGGDVLVYIIYYILIYYSLLHITNAFHSVALTFVGVINYPGDASAHAR